MQMFRARSQATKRVQGDYNVQYTMLRDYCEELLRANPGTTIKIEVEKEPNPHSPTRQFKRIYICLAGLKRGFQIAGRNLLGLDGCFMKGPYPGQVLTTVGIDANNGIYPVAYALVESESKASWTWFLMCLGDDLGLDPNSYFTFISDRQKGIIPAIEKVYPKAEHRFCLRHIHENMKPRWKGDVYKDLLWSCASVLTPRGWENAMKAVEEEDKDLHDWLKEIPPRHWSRSHFSGREKCDVLLNNPCEVFNRQLVYGRDKPIITCLEFIREYLMKNIVVVKKLIAKCNGPLTPAATRIFDAIKSEASQYTCIWTGGAKYQVSQGLDQRVVNLGERTCSCRKWDLTGMPCKHAVAAIWNQGLHGGGEPILERWVDQAYWYETWKLVYECTIEPINGMDEWPKSRCPTTLLPPKHHNQIGRPKKKRKKSVEELSQTQTQTQNTEASIPEAGKLTRKGNTVTCEICKARGHNKRTCKKRQKKQDVDASQDGASQVGASQSGAGPSENVGASQSGAV
ncbi:uncharacterized protein LOC110892939 [Helianthus annuus]|uniref:uncharacterized protein LOC110892939 n=1 Tax=Helianthus annuus TaxID=4232 RepID=UPI001652DFE2|nr:uncharacterized protein LOC110892939 [Helianthus annuus]